MLSPCAIKSDAGMVQAVAGAGAGACVGAGTLRRTSPSFVLGGGIPFGSPARPQVNSVPCVPLTPSALASFCPLRRVLTTCSSASGASTTAATGPSHSSLHQASTTAVVATLSGPADDSGTGACWAPTLHICLQDSLEVVNDTDGDLAVAVGVQPTSVDVGVADEGRGVESGSKGSDTAFVTLHVAARSTLRSSHLLRIDSGTVRVACMGPGATGGRGCSTTAPNTAPSLRVA